MDYQKITKTILKYLGKEEVFDEYILNAEEVNKLMQEPPKVQIEFLQKSVTKKTQKILDLLNLDELPKLRLKDGTVVSNDVAVACVATFFKFKQIIVPLENKLIESLFDHSDLARLGEYLYNEWNDSSLTRNRGPQDNKVKTILALTAYYCDDSFSEEFEKVIYDVLFLDYQYPLAFCLLQILANNRVKIVINMIKELLEYSMTKKQEDFAQDLLNTLPEEVSDLIVPNFGFDNNGMLVDNQFDESLHIKLADDFKLQYKNDKDKFVKTLPKEKQKYKRKVTKLKSEIKNTMNEQTPRLEKACKDERHWNLENFTKLFLDNYLIKRLSIGLVFCYEQTNGTTGTFVLSNNNTLENLDYDEIVLENVEKLYLLRVSSETTDLVDKWKEYISDNELKPVYNQFEI